MVAAEYEATQLYMQLAEWTNNKLAPDEEKFYAKGAKEVEEKIKKKK